MNTLTLENELSENLRENLFAKKPVRIVAIGLLLALLSACGSNVTPRATGLYSGGGPVVSTPILGSAGEALAECTTFDSTTARLGGKATTYYYSGVLQEDKVRVRITSLDSAFDTNSNYYIQAFRWRVNTSGAAEIDANPVQFHFENGAGSTDPIATATTSLSLASLSAIRTAKNISGTGAIDFFSKTTMVMNAVDYNWQALKIVLYDGSVTPARVVGQSDFLLPVFQANPNRYALSHNTILSQIHPFYSQSGQSLSETEWGNRTKSFCF